MLAEFQGLLLRLGFSPEKVKRVVIEGQRFEVWTLEGKESTASTQRDVFRVHRGYL